MCVCVCVCVCVCIYIYIYIYIYSAIRTKIKPGKIIIINLFRCLSTILLENYNILMQNEIGPPHSYLITNISELI